MALEWAIDNLVAKEDTLFLIHVKPSEGHESRSSLWSGTGSPLVPLAELRDPDFVQKYGVKFDPDVLGMVDTISRQKEVKVAGKVYWGDARDKLCAAVEELKLDCLVMGSRGLGTIQRLAGVAIDFSSGSKMALEWAIDNLVTKEDTQFLIHVKPSEGNESRSSSLIRHRFAYVLYNLQVNDLLDYESCLTGFLT
ncbi:hypothetical protein RHSIM_Rhsim13G0076000 [Rhododendron simsii]|uniref:UspA domain-containing protein n=1 Tax=Rhododendron simsii TaxID=118357 RepID=A0A834L5M8_RHOSS|nr:hypothetical protein RHSIM_Rhsim13G0076000 [Rhododendron simsii]